MLTRFFFLFALLVSAIAALTGARSGSTPLTPQAGEVHFTPHSAQLDADVISSAADVTQLLDKTLAKLSDNGDGWLKTKFRQSMHEPRLVVEGVLQRAPNHCARMETEVVVGQSRGRLIVVSDGELIAQVRTLSGTASTVIVEKLPTTGAARKEQHLIDNGCGGPHAMVSQLKQHLRNGKLQTGLLKDRPVIRIRGELQPASFPALARVASSALVAGVYVDAETLWPHRFEWSDSKRPLLQIDFYSVEIGRQLSFEECARLFSYQPDGSEQVTK